MLIHKEHARDMNYLMSSDGNRMRKIILGQVYITLIATKGCLVKNIKTASQIYCEYKQQ